MRNSKSLLTKSAFLLGMQCDRLLWVYQNQRQLMPEPDETQQAIFDQGHLVGNLAKALFPGGIEIDWSGGHEDGQTASLRFAEMAFGKTTAATKTAIRKALEIYCCQDTEGMVEIIRVLTGCARQKSSKE